jgi:hypothetical protein
MHCSYIVRVYRHEKDNPGIFVGTVEKIDGRGKAAFTNIDEFWEIVNVKTGSGMKMDKAQDTGRNDDATKNFHAK